jgi:ATP-dependent DNA helicase DinG
LSSHDHVTSPLVRAVLDALSADGPIAEHHAGFVAREGQLQLAQAIAEAIDSSDRLVAEAGTGTGKTFAYLVPALLSGARVLLSTGTRNLQDQLFGRDLPEMLRLLDLRAEVALLKGRANYVCHYHLKRNLAEGRFASRKDIADLRRIERFALVSDSGDRSALPGVPEEAPAWNQATSTRENCLGQDCPDLDRCFVFKARQAAQRADVIVVNHHLFCADLALREEGVADLLPTTDALVFDEAHQLPETATQFFGTSVSARRLLDFARDMLRAGLAEARDAADWTERSREIEQAVRELRLAAGQPGRLDAANACARPGFLEQAVQCLGRLEQLAELLAASSERGRELARCALRAQELCLSIRNWLTEIREQGAPRSQGDTVLVQELGSGVADQAAPAAESELSPTLREASASEPEQDRTTRVPVVVWAEVHGNGFTLHATPLSVAHAFRRHIAGRPRAWIFLSATLAVSGGFEHFRQALGVDDGQSLVSDSPFDYQSQALLYVPQGIGEPSGPDFSDRVFRQVWPLVKANRGRAFVLCTTLRMVEQLGRRFSDAIASEQAHEGLQFGLLVQGSASRAELLERFRTHPAPVLVGSASFWEGVDVPGKQLSLVIIDKLPFAPPDEPVLRARIEAARRAGLDPFRTMQLPAAAMALKQGAGRLIRSERDRGLLVVCDTRLADRSYGRTLLKSLPAFRRTREADEAFAFISQLDEPVSEVPG